MKKIISMALALCLVVGVMFALTSCFGAIPGGTYTADGLSGIEEAEFKVSGSKMVYTIEEDETKINFTFTYEVKEDKITVTYEGDDYEGDASLVKLAISAAEVVLKAALTGEKSFEKGDGYFKIGEIKFVKA